jgi:hypothetical protein
MKGIYISVPDNEFSFYMAVLERFKTATVLKTDEIKTIDSELNLHEWQIKELEEIIKEEESNPQKGIDAKTFLTQFRKELDV